MTALKHSQTAAIQPCTRALTRNGSHMIKETNVPMSAALRPLNDPQRMKAIFLDVPLRHQEAVPNRTFTHQDGQHSFRARENAFGTREHPHPKMVQDGRGLSCRAHGGIPFVKKG